MQIIVIYSTIFLIFALAFSVVGRDFFVSGVEAG